MRLGSRCGEVEGIVLGVWRKREERFECGLKKERHGRISEYPPEHHRSKRPKSENLHVGRKLLASYTLY